MDLGLPKASEFTPEQLRSKIFVHPEDRVLPHFYRLPLGEILDIINQLPPTVRNKHDHPIRLDNWNGLYQGRSVWGIPDWMDDDPRWDNDDTQNQEMKRKMSLQFWYQNHNYPEIQLGKILSVPFKKRLKAFQKTPEFAKLGKKLYVLKVELSPKHTSAKEHVLDRVEDPVVCWRLLTCHGDTNLNALHDQILAPAMGWRRNFHAYRYTVPTNGASIFPQDTSAMDKMHLTFSAPTFSLDTAGYDLRHLVQEPGQRLIYNYDMGDNWCHFIKVLKIEDMGATLKGADFEHLDNQTFKAVAKKTWTLQGSSLLWGEVNCPPENSEGCGGLGRYGNILKMGRDYEVPDSDRIINWKDHDIQCAFDFDLEAHRERFKAAMSGRQNSRDGALTFHTDPSVYGLNSGIPSTNPQDLAAMFGGAPSKSKTTKVSGDGLSSSVETVRKKKSTTSKCNSCGKVKGSNSGLKLFLCSRCKVANYCSVECQKRDWKKHKQTCTRPPAP